MSLSDLASLGSLVSGLAVLGSLIYLSIQTRQASKHQRSLMMQGRAARRMEAFYRRGDPCLEQAYEKIVAGKLDALSDFDLLQALSNAAAVFVSIEETWLEGEEGLQPEVTQDTTVRTLDRVFANPIFRATWPQFRISFDPEFVAVADRVMREAKCAPLAALTDTFRQTLANEIASARA